VLIVGAFITAGVAVVCLFFLAIEVLILTIGMLFNPPEIVAKVDTGLIGHLETGLSKPETTLLTFILLRAFALFRLKLCLTMKSYIYGCFTLGLKSRVLWHYF
jgi:hypothetical protein